MYCFSNCCRLCLTKTNTLVNITWSGSDGISYLNKLGQLAPSLVTNPRNYMSWICEQCRQKLKNAYIFIQHCIKSNAVFNEYCNQLPNTDTVQNKCTDSDVSDIQLPENVIKESIPISVKEECHEDLPATDDNQYYSKNTVTINEHKLSPINFEYVKVESSELKQEVDLNVGDDPTSHNEIIVSECDHDQPENVQQIDPIAGTSGENNITACSGPLSHNANRQAESFNINSSSTLIKQGSIKNRNPQNKRCFKCGICDKTFTQSSDLKRHERIHSGERPYECKICHVRFTDSGNLKVHERVHSGERPFKCNICDRTFTHAGGLKQHERFHSGERPYKCKMCIKQFSTSGNLQQHERFHSGERPYECKICNRTFTQSENLKRHERIHSGERPYECKFCNKAFSQSGILKRHEAVHSRDCS